MDNMDKEALIVNCDGTYPLDSVVSLLESVSKDIGVHVVPQQKTFPLSQLQAVSEEVWRRQLLCGVFVVNAYESRLSINEEKAGIGYAVLYRALLEAAQGRVLVVIGGDDRYKAGEQDTSVLSTWAYHKIAAQFDDTYLDGRRGFVFSWDERHNPVHQEALGSYLRAITAGKRGLHQPFKPTPPPKPLPKPEPILPPSASTDQRKSQTRQTPKLQPAKTNEEDAAPNPAVKRLSRHNMSERAAKHEGARSDLPVNYDVKYTQEQANSILETLKKHKDEIQKTKPLRKIKFVGHLVSGKLVPGFCEAFREGHVYIKGNRLEDIPDFVIETIETIKSQEGYVQKESASLIVFDEGADQNCNSVRELAVPKVKEDNFFVRGCKQIYHAMAGD
ncbi:PREDICTED: uncharacterized protein LOC109487629 [Branchiostoma belcheri]|uniref:Uncharacterized protein LOC109487629 n=1 Tax=Branchiostoma belcheri TaxID=7741 RepID=A0A6P5AVS1_BRABE|nr:PREDICTED: uncharacterized protein LOC109487629 [Branchiostoma belcheri]